jgi:ribosomal protein S18 acetylase RimI-like enzyme
MEIRARELSLGQGSSLGIFVAAVNTAIRGVLEEAGHREVRTFFRMRIDLAPTAPPAPASGAPESASVPAFTPRPGAGSIEIRPLRLGTDDRALYEVLEESFAEHFRPSPRPFDEWWALRARHPRFLPELWLLAWDGERVAGALTAYDFVDIGFISMLGVRKPWRGRGLGSSLLTRSFETFRVRGQLRVSLGVDAENESAVGLYERVGMRVEQRHHLMQKRLGG